MPLAKEWDQRHSPEDKILNIWLRYFVISSVIWFYQNHSIYHLQCRNLSQGRSLNLSGRESQGILSSKAFTTDPSTTAIFRRAKLMAYYLRCIYIKSTKHISHFIGAILSTMHEPDLCMLSCRKYRNSYFQSHCFCLSCSTYCCVYRLWIQKLKQTLFNPLASGFLMGSEHKHKHINDKCYDPRSYEGNFSNRVEKAEKIQEFFVRFIILFWDICDLLDRVCDPVADLFSSLECFWIQRNYWSAKYSPYNTIEEDETRPRGCKYPTQPRLLAKILPETTVRA